MPDTGTFRLEPRSSEALSEAATCAHELVLKRGLNRVIGMRERNPLLLDAQLALGEEETVGALLFGGEVAKHGGAVTGIGDREVSERGDGKSEAKRS